MLRSPTIPSAGCKLRPRRAGGRFKGLRAGRRIPAVSEGLRTGARGQEQRTPQRRLRQSAAPSSTLSLHLGPCDGRPPSLRGAQAASPRLLDAPRPRHLQGAQAASPRLLDGAPAPVGSAGCFTQAAAPGWPFALRLLMPGRNTALKSAPAGLCRQSAHRVGGWGPSLLIIRDQRSPLCRSEKLRGQSWGAGSVLLNAVSVVGGSQTGSRSSKVTLVLELEGYSSTP